MTWRILISAPYLLPLPEEYRSKLEAEGAEIVTVDVAERLNEETLLSVVADIDGIICGDDPFTEKVFNKATRLKVISKWGTGIDSIDQAAAACHGVTVCNTPDAFSDPVADTTMGYVLNFARRLSQLDREIRQGQWTKQTAVALRHCTLGIIGVGNIGKAVARRAKAFGMNVMGSDVAQLAESFLTETQIQMVGLEELLSKSDFVSLHCDLNPSSYHLIGASALSVMQRHSYLINTSRGKLIDEAALVYALRREQIAGAALDVFENEPLPIDSPLRTFQNCLLAPHNANSDPTARRRVHESTINNLIRALKQ